MKSKGYIKYLKKRKKEKISIILIQILLLLFLLFIWQYASNHNLINTFITSSPSLIIKTIIKLYNTNNLFQHIFITTYEVIISFLIGTIIGLIIAIILWYNPFIAKILDPYLTILNSLPKVSLSPILIIIIGANIKTIIITSILISIITTIISIYNSFNSTDKNKIKLLKSLNASKLQILTNLVLPSNYPSIINTLKITLSLSLIGVITAELLVSKKGIGYLITYGKEIFNLNLVITGIFILMILSYILYLIICYIEKILIKNN